MTRETMGEVLRRWARERPDADAIVGETRTVTYGELDRITDALATGLCAVGARTGDRVAGILPNDWEAFAAWLACVKGGFVFVPINPGLQSGELGTLAGGAP